MNARALVTGAGRGIGAAIADRLAAEGFEVVRVDIVESADVVQCDVSEARAVESLAARIGPAEVLVNNAGIWSFTPLEDTDPADFERVLQVNLQGAFNTTRSFGPAMLEAGHGSIVNVVSIAAQHANPAVGAYSASKAGLVALTRQTAIEWGPRGVRCNAVGPGLVPTEGAGIYADAEVRRVRSAVVPLRRLGRPEEVAEVVAFLASARAAYVTGQVLYVDGGLSSALMTTLPRPPGVAGPRMTEIDPDDSQDRTSNE